MSGMSLLPLPLRAWLAALLLAAVLPACGKKASPSASASAPADVASAAVDTTGDETTTNTAAGAALYESVCATCHAEGVGKAPRFGNRADWEARLGQGEDALLQSVINGKGIMPPKGTALDASDEELRTAVRYMTESATAGQ